jgi:sugar phosphate isomerase/epimerase
MIIPGMVSATFRAQSAEWIIERCKMAKLQAVEWSENAHVFPDDVTGAAVLYEKTKAAGLDIAAYGSYYRLGQQEQPEDCFLKSLKSAIALKAPVIRIWAGSKPSSEVSEEELTALSKEASLIAEMAQEHQIKIALEWHKNTLTDTNESAMEFLRRADHNNLYFLWQPTVALSMKERTEGLALIQDRLLNLHIYYWKDGVKRPLEEGIFQWQEYLSQIDQRVPRYGLLEFVMNGTEEQFLQDAEALHRMLRVE